MAIFSQELREMDEYKDSSPVSLVEDFQKDQQQLQLGLSLEQTSGVNPDEHAEALKISDKVGLPADSVRQDLPAQREKVRQLDIDRPILMKEHPKLSKVLTDPDFAKVSADDFDVLKSIEGIFTTAVEEGTEIIEDVTIGYESGKITDELGILGHAAMISGATPEQQERITELQARLQTLEGSGGFLEEAATIVGQMVQGLPEAAEKGIMVGGALGTTALIAGQLGPQVLAPEEVLTVPVATMAGFSAGFGGAQAERAYKVEGGHAYLDMVESGIDKDTARVVAKSVGTINAALEMVGVSAVSEPARKLFSKMMRDAVAEHLVKPTMLKAVKGFAIDYTKAWAGEVTTEVLQEIVTIAGGEIARQITPEEMESLLLTPEGRAKFKGQIAGIFEQVGKGMAILALPGATVNFVHDTRKVRQANKNQRVMEALGDASKESKTRQRAPKQFQNFIDETTKDGPVENVYISAEKFDEYFQTEGIEIEEIIAEMPELREQLIQARERGGDIVIPINLYAGKIVGTEHHSGLIQDIKFNPTELTPREAAELKENLPKIMEDYIKEEQGRLDREITDQDSYDRILEAATKIQVEGGELRTQSVKRAELLARTFTTLGERYNLDPVKLFEGYGIEVKGPAQQEIAKVEDIDSYINKVRRGRIPKQREAFGKTLLETLADRGGVIDEGGELSARDADKWHLKRYNKRFVKEGGLSLDGAREAAIEEGFLNEGDDVNELMEAIDKELRGENVYADKNIDQAKADQLQETQTLIDYLSQKGIDLATATNEEVKLALEGAEQQAGEKVIEYNQVEDFSVEIEAIEEETGRTIRISENADIALQEVDTNISVLQELIECVG